MAKTPANDTIRAANRQRVLACLRRDGPLSRTELVLKAELSSATVSAITADLLAEGRLAREDDVVIGQGRGRPQVPLAFAPNFAMVQAAYLAVDGIVLLLADHAGRVLDQRRLSPLPRSSAIDDAAASLAQGLADQARAMSVTVRQVVVAVQGVVDAQGRRIVWSPILDHPQLDLAPALAQRRQATVTLVNDGVAIVDGLSPGRNEDLGVVLTGYGIGMGLVLGGRSISGRHHSALEFGHLNHIPGGALCRCGRRGCVEAYAGDYAIARLAGLAPLESTDHPDDTVLEALAERASAGEPLACAAFAEAGRALGYGLARTFALLGPFPVHLVGERREVFHHVRPHIRIGLDEALVPALRAGLKLVHHVDGRGLALAGAVARALRQLDAEGSPERGELQP